MKKIVTHLWFDTQAKEAVEFYTTLFPHSKIISSQVITDTPSGDCDILSFEILDTPFMAISAGPYFTFNPSISLMVNFDPSKDPDARERIDDMWETLVKGGKVLMPLDTYPFSERYGWVEDMYGLSWQLIYTRPEGEDRPPIIPSLLFVKEAFGKAEEASDFYISVFKDSKRGVLARYGSDHGPAKEGTIMFTDFSLSGQWFTAMDGEGTHDFAFNEAVSFVVKCDTQEEIDYFWEKLSAVPESEQCGWLKDAYGVSWQIVPAIMDEMMTSGDQEAINRVTQAFLAMKKFDIATLTAAYEGKS